MSVSTEFHSTLCRTYHTLCISVRRPITEVKAEWNVAADVREIGVIVVRPFPPRGLCRKAVYKLLCPVGFSDKHDAMQ